jgi:ankyrin repeat protein
MSAEIQAFIDAVVKRPDAARQMLRESPELLDARYIHGETVLHFLAVEGYVDGVRLLAAAGADVDARNPFGDTALVDAVTLGNARVVAVLLEHGADPNVLSTVRDNVVHAAAGCGNPEVLDLVLSAGGRGDYVTELGETVWDAVFGRAEARDRMETILRKHGVGRPAKR